MKNSLILQQAPRWHPAPSRQGSRKILPPLMASWILEEGSLTQRLRNHFSKDVTVHLLQQGFGYPPLAEAEILGLPHPCRVIIREVALMIAGTPLMLARSLIPRSTIVKADHRLWRLGAQPLGDILFTHPNLQRPSLEYARIQLRPGICGLWSTDRVWSRRSLYTLGEDAPLLVAECFLPALLQTPLP